MARTGKQRDSVVTIEVDLSKVRRELADIERRIKRLPKLVGVWQKPKRRSPLK